MKNFRNDAVRNKKYFSDVHAKAEQIGHHPTRRLIQRIALRGYAQACDTLKVLDRIRERRYNVVNRPLQGHELKPGGTD